MLFDEALSQFIVRNPLYQPSLQQVPPEEVLLKLLTEEELESLQLPLFLRPKILRRIPRLVQPSQRTYVKIKPGFTDLSFLKRHWIDKALLYLYQLHFEPQKGSCLLLTFAFPDGRGDLYTHLHAKKFLQKTFPQLNLDAFLFMHHAFEWKGLESPILYASHRNQHYIHEAFSKDHLDILEKTDLILEIPTAFPLISLLKKRYPHALFERLGEQNLIEAIQFQPQQARCMGLHFLEKGIFIKETVKASFSDLQSPYLSTFLGKARFNFAYTKTLRGTSLYLLTLLYALHASKEDLDICLFHFPSLIDFASTHQNVFYGIQKIDIYTENTKTSLKLHKKGKTVRLFLCKELSHEDSLALFSLSQDFVGCTGDQSVLEALATGLPFLYDPPPFKRLFLQDLSLLAPDATVQEFLRLSLKNETLLSAEPDAGYVSEDTLEWMDACVELEDHSLDGLAQKMGRLLQSPTLRQGFQELKAYLALNYPIEPILKGIVARALCHRKYPKTARAEKTLVDLFIQEKISAKELLTKLRKEIAHLAISRIPCSSRT